MEPLSAVDDRLYRAEHHFKLLKRMLRSYYASNPYTIHGKYNIEKGGTIGPLYVESPPERFHTLVGEFLHNLRSALDHLAWQLVERTGGVPDKDTGFPILKPQPAAHNKWVRPPLHISGNASSEVLTFIDSKQPYQLDGLFFTHPLWRLHRLAIIDRHRHIATRGAGLERISVSFTDVPRQTEIDWTAYTTWSDEFGAEIELRPDDPDVNMDGTATLQILVTDVGHQGIGGTRAVPLLSLLANADSEVRDIAREAQERIPKRS